jgi:hypothetical protein
LVSGGFLLILFFPALREKKKREHFMVVLAFLSF